MCVAELESLPQRGEKVIIWSSFVQNVELIALRLSDLGAEFIHGGVDAGDENALILVREKSSGFIPMIPVKCWLQIQPLVQRGLAYTKSVKMPFT